MAILAFDNGEDQICGLRNLGGYYSTNYAARTGTYSLGFNPYNYYRARGVAADFPNKDEVYFQIAMRLYYNLDGTSAIIDWRNGNTIVGCLAANGTGGLRIYRGDQETNLNDSASGMIAGQWYVLEGYIKIDSSSGVIQIRKDGVPILSYSGDTTHESKTDIDNIAFWIPSTGVQTNPHCFDDIVVVDTLGSSFNTWLNGVKIWKVAAPTANGNYSEWTPFTGSNYENIDESPPTMVDYISTQTVGNVDTYSFGDADASIKAIGAVVTRYWGQGGGQIKRVCRYGGSDYSGSNIDFPPMFTKVDDIMYEKPGGGIWTPTVFNACEFGIELVS